MCKPKIIPTGSQLLALTSLLFLSLPETDVDSSLIWGIYPEGWILPLRNTIYCTWLLISKGDVYLSLEKVHTDNRRKERTKCHKAIRELSQASAPWAFSRLVERGNWWCAQRLQMESDLRDQSLLHTKPGFSEKWKTSATQLAVLPTFHKETQFLLTHIKKKKHTYN